MMEVFAFVGKSGTGKSYRALMVAKQNNIDYIVDDGLLISSNKIIAGMSAKKEATAVAATKRALFFDKLHSRDVSQAIRSCNPNSILIIGTSDKMVNIIRKALDLPEILRTIYITDVATPKEIIKASQSRRVEGKHVIPVPTFELKKTFSGYFLDALSILNRIENVSFSEEKTIIRPSFSYMGRYYIYDKVIRQLSKNIISTMFNINKVSVFINSFEGNVAITLNMVINYSELDKSLFSKIQETVINEIERLTCMNVIGVNIVIKSLEV